MRAPGIDAQCLGRIREELIERASRALGVRAVLDVQAPQSIDARAWARILGDHTYNVAGSHAQVILTLDRADACAIARAAFGMNVEADARCSPIEARVLSRFVEAIAPAFVSYVGPELSVEAIDARDVPHTVTAIRITAPVQAIFGVGLLGEPPPATRSTLDWAALLGCALECAVTLGTTTLSLQGLSELRVGDVVRLSAKVGHHATMNVGGELYATGEAGVVADAHSGSSRSAMYIHAIAGENSQ